MEKKVIIKLLLAIVQRYKEKFKSTYVRLEFVNVGVFYTAYE